LSTPPPYPPGDGPYSTPYGAPTPPRRGIPGWVIGIVVGAVVLLLVCGGLGAFLVTRASDNNNEPSNTTPTAGVSVEPEPSVEPTSEPTSEPTENSSPDSNGGLTGDRLTVKNGAVKMLTEIHQNATEVGFASSTIDYVYLVREGEPVTCNGRTLLGSEDDFPAYWCSSTKQFYFEEAAVVSALTEPSAGLDGAATLRSYILNSYAIVAAEQRGASVSVARHACTTGVFSRAEVTDGRLTLTSATTIRGLLTDSDAEASAFTAGYNSPQAATCDKY
jgi:hypothetical protein